jgi:heme-degrading monooxygenase HmoA
LATHLPLDSYLATPRFLRLVRSVQRQLSGTPGLVGYTLLAKPLKRQYWTLSMWDDESALQAFVGTKPHLDVMSTLSGDMGSTQFVRWQVRGAEAHPTWPDALARLQAADDG